jgi:RNA processing factor Prp31
VYSKEEQEIKNLVSITEDFLKFVGTLYKEGTITHEQYNDMTATKNEFLKNIKLQG